MAARLSAGGTFRLGSCSGAPAVLGEGLPEETTRCGHGKVPPTFYRNMEFPAFNHFLSNCHLETDQSTTDTGSPLGNFIRGTEFWLEAGTPGPRPQQALKMAGRLLKVSGARHRPCQSPKHFHIHCSMSSTKPMVNCPHGLNEKTASEELHAVFKVTPEGATLASVRARSLGAAGSLGR